MFLFFLILVLCVLSAVLTKIINYILGLFNKPTQLERELMQEIIDIRQKLQNIPMVDNFVAHAKLQRKLNVVESNLRDETNRRLSKGLKSRTFVPYALNGVLSLIIIAISIIYRHEPVVKLQEFNLFPISLLISYPLHEFTSISVPAWFCICKVVIKELTS